MRKSIFLFLSIIIPLIMSCGVSAPTSDKSKTLKVSGVVTDKNGSGISGVTVQITGTNFSATDTTDSGGAFAFENVKPGDYKFKAQKDRCIFKPASIELAGAKIDTDTLRFTSSDNYIHGRVLDIITGKGIKGVRIGFINYDRLYCGAVITDSNGEFGIYDLAKNGYHYFYETDYYVSGETDFSIEPSVFENREIVLKTYYFSSEKLRITKAEFIKDTQTLNLEWNPSVSKYIKGYFVHITNNPGELDSLGTYPIDRGYYVSGNNKDSRKITAQMLTDLFDDDIISGVVYLAVSAVYQIGNYTYYGPYPDMISIRLYW